jgi:hypothetical protein
LKYYANEHGSENVFISQDKNGHLSIEVIENEDKSNEE